MGDKPASAFTAAEQLQQLERHWVWGGQSLVAVFSDPNDPASGARAGRF
jgi:hypothetical protein